MSANTDSLLEAASGYYELGMISEALEEMNAIPDEDQQEPDVLFFRIALLLQQRNWSDALEYCETLTRLHPQKTEGYIHQAYCLHELKRTAEARKTLLSGPKKLHKNPLYHYNLACYAAALGNRDEAQQLLETSLRMDPSLRETAAQDPDLEPLRKG